MTACLLEAMDLYRFFHTQESETLALRGVSLTLREGELVALMGPSGSGKSTLLACLASLDVPDGGHVEFLGMRLTRLSDAERARRRAQGIGILLQSGNLFSGLTVADNVRLPMRLIGQANEKCVDALLADVGLWDRRHAYPGQLSGGEAARAGLAVALANAPQILLADEPTGEVDAETELRILTLFDRRRESGMAILVATHSTFLARHASRVIQLRDGRLHHD
ncbi:ABC transporter ATP-binding protein [Microvirga puerhi]|uniref:ABC transporter ATP-binding protein n=1 Tax=Microvirga puerhi TaxID=2876078 RepID=A0ABS7VTJ3_9HYPH|nr:ABC transporter ATP-binding protein [Microvirga puerhi]MBZ6078875.1 ABC transporter ATP-binding protein [Microvirga puerhi]